MQNHYPSETPAAPPSRTGNVAGHSHTPPIAVPRNPNSRPPLVALATQLMRRPAQSGYVDRHRAGGGA